MGRRSWDYIIVVTLIIFFIIFVSGLASYSTLSDIIGRMEEQRQYLHLEIRLIEDVNDLEDYLYDYIHEWELLLIDGDKEVQFEVHKRNMERVEKDFKSRLQHFTDRMIFLNKNEKILDGVIDSSKQLFDSYSNAIEGKTYLTRIEVREFEYMLRKLDDEAVTQVHGLKEIISNLYYTKSRNGVEVFINTIRRLKNQILATYIFMAAFIIGVLVVFRRFINRVFLEKEDILKELECINEQLSEQKDKIEGENVELQKEVVMDKMTGLFNQSYMKDYLNRLVLNHSDGEYFTVIFFDIDHFKNINDTFGHNVGDDVLTKVSNLLHSSFREDDLIGRYGGEEFIVILENCKIDAAYRAAEFFRKKLESYNYFQRDIKVTISGGVKEYDGSTYTTFIEKVDLLLYEAKRQGRNRIIKETIE